MDFYNTIVSRCLTFVVIIVHILSRMPQTQSFSRDDLFADPGPFEFVTADASKTRFTAEEKELILEIHNAYRSLVYPFATDMKELIWDDDLEEYAYNHTQACTGTHSRRTMVKKFTQDDPDTWETWNAMAENLFYSFAPKYSIQEALYMFWAEGKDYDVINDICSSQCGHYQAVVLAESSRIGCAMKTCDDFSESSYPTPAVYIACDYNGPLLTGVRPYTVGEKCSYCDRHKLGYEFQYCRNGLCVSPAQYYEHIGYDGNTSVVGLQDMQFPDSTTDTSTSGSTTAPTTSTEPQQITTLEANTTTSPTTLKEPQQTTTLKANNTRIVKTRN